MEKEENIGYTEEMREYEIETGKKAIWHGSITEGFKKWRRGETIYGMDKKGIGILVDDETKIRWENYVNEHKNEFSTISKLIRKAVNFYIDFHSNKAAFKNISKISHSLKEPLTAIQGFAQLIIDLEASDLKASVLDKIQKILTQSIYLEEKINEILNDVEPKRSKYDVLIIEDDAPTISVLIDYFDSRGYSCNGVSTGTKGLEELNLSIPKLILLDIMLPDMNGYDLCKIIKDDKRFGKIPLYYITAIPESEVIQNVKKTGADGYFLKPFKFPKLQEELFKYL